DRMAGTSELTPTMRVLAAILIFCAAAAGVSPVEAVPRPGAVEIKGPKGVLGQLPLETMDDGASYVPAERLAGLLKGSWTAKGKTGTLTVSKRSVQFSRDQSRLTLQGQPLVLDSAPRATAKGWLLPLDFLDKGLGRPAPGPHVIRRRAAPPSPLSPPPPHRHRGGLGAVLPDRAEQGRDSREIERTGDHRSPGGRHRRWARQGSPPGVGRTRRRAQDRPGGLRRGGEDGIAPGSFPGGG